MTTGDPHCSIHRLQPCVCRGPLYIAPPEPDPLPKVLPKNTTVWRRLSGESVEDALKRYDAQSRAYTMSVGSTDDLDNIHIPGFENAPTITTTGADLSALEPGSIMVPIERRYVGIDMAVGPDRTVVATYDGALGRIAKLIDLGLPMKMRDVLDRLGLILRSPRGRRSRRNRSARARGARRLHDRVSPSTSGGAP